MVSPFEREKARMEAAESIGRHMKECDKGNERKGSDDVLCSKLLRVGLANVAFNLALLFFCFGTDKMDFSIAGFARSTLIFAGTALSLATLAINTASEIILRNAAHSDTVNHRTTEEEK